MGESPALACPPLGILEGRRGSRSEAGSWEAGKTSRNLRPTACGQAGGETHGIVLPATSRNSGADWERRPSKISEPAPELNAHVESPTHTCLRAEGTSAGRPPSISVAQGVILFSLAPEIIGRWGGRLDRAFISGRGSRFRSVPTTTRPEIQARGLAHCHGSYDFGSSLLSRRLIRLWRRLLFLFLDPANMIHLRAGLFKEKVTDASALDQVASLLPGRVVLQSEIRRTIITVH